eukprot:scaffold41244_cov30-Tisochrysis_lutea.AAC.3
MARKRASSITREKWRPRSIGRVARTMVCVMEIAPDCGSSGYSHVESCTTEPSSATDFHESHGEVIARSQRRFAVVRSLATDKSRFTCVFRGRVCLRRDRCCR